MGPKKRGGARLPYGMAGIDKRPPVNELEAFVLEALGRKPHIRGIAGLMRAAGLNRKTWYGWTRDGRAPQIAKLQAVGRELETDLWKLVAAWEGHKITMQSAIREGEDLEGFLSQLRELSAEAAEVRRRRGSSDGDPLPPHR
jgi:hypothetical protein